MGLQPKVSSCCSHLPAPQRKNTRRPPGNPLVCLSVEVCTRCLSPRDPGSRVAFYLRDLIVVAGRSRCTTSTGSSCARPCWEPKRIEVPLYCCLTEDVRKTVMQRPGSSLEEILSLSPSLFFFSWLLHECVTRTRGFAEQGKSACALGEDEESQGRVWHCRPSHLVCQQSCCLLKPLASLGSELSGAPPIGISGENATNKNMHI